MALLCLSFLSYLIFGGMGFCDLCMRLLSGSSKGPLESCHGVAVLEEYLEIFF